MPRLQGGELLLDPSSVFDTNIAPSPNRISVTKLIHLHKVGTTFNQDIADTPVSAEVTKFVATIDGTNVIRKFGATLADTGTSTDIDFDLNVNGASVLSAPVNFTHVDSDGDVKEGTISSGSLSINDVVTIQMTVTSATGALGAFAWVEIAEPAAT